MCIRDSSKYSRNFHQIQVFLWQNYIIEEIKTRLRNLLIWRINMKKEIDNLREELEKSIIIYGRNSSVVLEISQRLDVHIVNEMNKKINVNNEQYCSLIILFHVFSIYKKMIEGELY
eukprot:TRINITY_DN42825_c0_g1_i1.p3 TRINITY_DN42825_c0_g1~~TRINITY_DN42825_c0_g1_i1.p3  ORF type:complete len:117 (-),score=10.52 TRINITY_DN42825_c0_g1_i1:118-468(-)